MLESQAKIKWEKGKWGESYVCWTRYGVMEEGGLLQVFCYRAGNEIEELDLEEERMR